MARNKSLLNEKSREELLSWTRSTSLPQGWPSLRARRTQPGLPLSENLIASRTHDYKRHGTTALFAAFIVLTGEVAARLAKRSRSKEYESEKGINAKTEEDLQAIPVAANQSGYRNYQSDSAGLSQLSSAGYVEPLFWIHQRLGWKQGSTPFDDGQRLQGLGWDR